MSAANLRRMHKHREQSPYRSRKFTFACLTLAVLCASFVFVARYPAAIPAFGEFVTGVVAVSLSFLGGNVAAQWVDQRHGKPADPLMPPEPRP